MPSFSTLTRRLLSATTLILAAASAHAGIVLDWSPQATGATVVENYWTNQASGQHFAERVNFSASTTINGIDIYDGVGFGGVGSMGQITIWSNTGAQPGGVLASYTSAITIADNSGTAGSSQQRLHADFSGFVMQAGVDYWIGMSGFNLTLTQTSLSGVAGGDGVMAMFGGSSFAGFPQIGDMAFRLHGEQAATVPEPATLALTGLALVGIACTRRKRQA